MESFLWIVLVLFIIYFVFVAAPAVTFFICVFLRKFRTDGLYLDERNVYFAPYAARLSEDAAYLRRLPQYEIIFSAGDGTRLHALFLDAKSRKTAVLLHGYHAPLLNNFAAQAACLYREGFNIAFLFQRAHGPSEGYTTMGCKEQRDLLEFLPVLTRETATEEILLYGMSMGCAAVSLASDRLDPSIVKGMILDCGYTSPYIALTDEMRRHRVPVFLMKHWMLFLTRAFLGVQIEKPVTENLAHTRVPALFLHGNADQTVSVLQGKRNYDSCASPKEWYCVPSAVHTTCFLAGAEEAKERLLTFVHTYFYKGDE